MDGKRERLARVLDRAGVWNLLLWARSHGPSPFLTVLTYHRVGEPSGETRFDPAVIDATPTSFDAQVEFLARHFNIIGIDELLEFRRGKSLPKNPVLITFDDGYLDCYNVVLPILQRHGARATFFIPTHYIEKRRLFWWDRITFLVTQSEREEIQLTYPRTLRFALGSRQGDAVRELLRLVKTEVELDLERFLSGVAAATGVDFDADREREWTDDLLMTWDQIEALGRAGMDIQSHTRTHRVLGTLSKKDLKEELEGSRRELEAHLDRPVKAIAYPVGYRVADSPAIEAALTAAGYELGFTNQTGVNVLGGRFKPLDIGRHAMEADMTDPLFRAVLAFPYLARTRR
jgi:peptidoglycan/xylan/chitin deacetylase (PgdA/CDA1 family)